MSRTRLESCSGSACSAAPLAWASQLVVGFGVARRRLQRRRQPLGRSRVEHVGDRAGGRGRRPSCSREAAASPSTARRGGVDDDAPGRAAGCDFFAVGRARSATCSSSCLILLDGVGAVYHLAVPPVMRLAVARSSLLAARGRGRRRPRRAAACVHRRRREAARRCYRRQLRARLPPGRAGEGERTAGPAAARRRRARGGLLPAHRLHAARARRTSSRAARACSSREREIRALVAYVASLGTGPPIPTPHPERGNVAEGLRLFTEHCAGCHQIAAEGGYVTGARVPPLEDATPRQIAEAVRIGPYLMPQLLRRRRSRTAQLDSIVATSHYAKHPDDRGGWALGQLGPVPEGMVAWLHRCRRPRRHVHADRQEARA